MYDEDEHLYVKVMAEFCSSGLWNEQHANTDESEYGLSPEILARLDAWQGWYDRDNKSYCTDPEEDVFPYEAFAKEGEMIARHIKAANPQWRVWYFNEHRYQNDLGSYEYEIH